MTSSIEKVVYGKSRHSRNRIGESCHYCEQRIEHFPYFVKLGSRGRPRLYHLVCAEKAGFELATIKVVAN